jgi:hypothetical protein
MANQSVFQIFVSHSHKDNQFGVKLVHDLKLKLGDTVKVWYDTAGGLDSGDKWWTKILRELAASSAFIVILSPDAIASMWVNDEINIAWGLKNSQKGKLRLIIPILYQDCNIRADLNTLQIVSFLAPTPYEAALGTLTKRLEKFRSELSNSMASLESADTSSFVSKGTKTSRQKIISAKASGRFNPEGRKAHESLHSVHQRTALRQARKEAEAEERAAADMNNVEFSSLPLSPNKRPIDKPIILEIRNTNKT